VTTGRKAQEALRLVVAYASQEPEFFPALSGMENLSLLQLLAEEPSEYLEKAVTTSLDLGLTKKDLERKQAGNYSGGMRQKLWIAAQLAKSRDFVILDEPFTSLDDETINTVSDMLKRDPRTRLLVSHQIPEGIDFADIIDLLGEDKEEDEG